jgi:hypothetical protein
MNDELARAYASFEGGADFGPGESTTVLTVVNVSPALPADLDKTIENLKQLEIICQKLAATARRSVEEIQKLREEREHATKETR